MHTSDLLLKPDIPQPSLEPRLSILDLVLQLWRKIQFIYAMLNQSENCLQLGVQNTRNLHHGFCDSQFQIDIMGTGLTNITCQLLFV